MIEQFAGGYIRDGVAYRFDDEERQRFLQRERSIQFQLAEERRYYARLEERRDIQNRWERIATSSSIEDLKAVENFLRSRRAHEVVLRIRQRRVGD